MVAFVRGSLSPELVERVEAHLDGCTQCRLHTSELALLGSSLSLAVLGTQSLAHLALGPPAGPVQCGDIIGRYVVLGQLGAGGMGVVAAAYDPDLDRRVALKLVRPDIWLSAAETWRARLLAEARAMARLSHPNVVAIYDIGSCGEQAFIAMEYVDGITFRQWLEAARRSWRQIVQVAMATGRGLAAAHRAGLIHRDVKPHNILVAADGRVLVADFGLAAMSREDDPDDPALPASGRAELERRTARNAVRIGTPAYMAPETYLGHPSDARSDQWSFCVMLYEALYGERPFSGGSRAELAAAVVGGRLPPPPRGSDVPPWLRHALLRGLATDPEQRFASMEELLAALSPAWWRSSAGMRMVRSTGSSDHGTEHSAGATSGSARATSAGAINR